MNPDPPPTYANPARVRPPARTETEEILMAGKNKGGREARKPKTPTKKPTGDAIVPTLGAAQAARAPKR
jgi:hypothetical protein